MDIVRRKLMQVADLQWGRVSARQLRDLGATEGRITRWISNGYLRQVLPHVYAVGHVAESVEADLIAAILYAGPDAMLSHATALWWYGLFEHQPIVIQVSTPRKCAPRPGLEVHARRTVHLIHHRRVPTTTVAQAMLDFSATAPVDSVIRALAEADYRRVLDPRELRAICGRGRPGSATLEQALRNHTPELARTKSALERAFRSLCRRGGIPAYEVNYRLCGFVVDAFWPDLGVVVELDGVQGHATPAQIRRDHRRDLTLRAAGYVVVRYSYDQVMYEPDAVLADLRAVLENAARRRAS
jgi:very-short-patch-repair endonuclease